MGTNDTLSPAPCLALFAVLSAIRDAGVDGEAPLCQNSDSHGQRTLNSGDRRSVYCRITVSNQRDELLMGGTGRLRSGLACILLFNKTKDYLT